MRTLRNIFGTAAAILLIGSFFLHWVRWIDPFSGLDGFSGLSLSAVEATSFGISDPWLWIFPAIGLIVLVALLYVRLPLERVETGFGLILLICFVTGFVFTFSRANMWLTLLAPQLAFNEGARLLVQGMERADGTVIRAGVGIYGSLAGLVCAGFSGIFALASAVNPMDVESQTAEHTFAPLQPVFMPLPRSMTMVDGVADTIPDAINSPIAEENTSFAWLIAVEGDSLPIGSTFTIGTARTTIGRTGQNALVLSDKSVSGRHAEIFRKADQFTLFDLESSNGSFVYNNSLADWQRITQYELKDGDRLKFGRTIFSFVHV
ncbi:MAG: FHA domain-containing protein [Chloroflexota bacterium]